MADKIQTRRDDAGNWQGYDPILALGELGYDTDNLRLKIGDGSSDWNSIVRYATFNPLQHVKAWAAFDGTPTLIVPADSFNVSGVARGGVGIYTVSFSKPMSNAIFCVTATSTCAATTTPAMGVGYVTIWCQDRLGNYVNSPYVSVVVFGTQAY